MISVIIPTLNEKKYLPFVLESLKKQNFNDYEIIVADAGSLDNTVSIAQKYGCRIVKGGLPARGRNEGAKFARGEWLFFLDADAVLPEKFFEKALEEIEKRKLDFAAFCLLPIGKKPFVRLTFNFYNWYIIMLEKILPHASQGILVKRDIFLKVGGYDETIKLAEDHDLARRAKKVGKYGIIKSCKIFISDRRFRKDGWFRTSFKYLLCELYMIFKGPVRTDIFKYQFNHYDKI